MYPYEKKNLIPYRTFLCGGLVLALISIGFGIAFHRPMGVFFAANAMIAAMILATQLFVWQPEPTAKRQFALAIGVVVVLGALGAFAVDAAISQYFLRNGECPIWLDFSGRCRGS